MRRSTMKAVIGLGSMLGGTVLIAGCRDDTPPPPRVPIPASRDRDPSALYEHEDEKPLPQQPPMTNVPPPPFEDAPLVSQEPPEQPAFVDAYRRVGSPRITLFVNRTMEGNVMPVNPDGPAVTVEHTQRSTGGVNVETHDRYDADAHAYGYYSSAGSNAHSDQSNSFKTNGPAEYRETTDVYLHPGQYDDASARSLDYEAIENIMTDWMSANGAVTIISPTVARQRLTDDQVKDLQSGRPQALSEVAQQLNADILIQVQAHPTEQTSEGLKVRMVAEALNTRGGQQIGRAVADVTLPLDKPKINRFTRYMARKLMMDMTQTWTSPPPSASTPPPAAPSSATPPAAPPPPPAVTPQPPPPPADVRPGMHLPGPENTPTSSGTSQP